jgi:hypothetical protein
MAKTLSKSGITDGSTIEVSHVTQSIDALIGIDAYDITISGSLTLSGGYTNDRYILGGNQHSCN